MNYFNFLDEKADQRQLLWNHYLNCCKVLGLKIDISSEEYFANMDDEQVNKFVDFMNLDLESN